MRSILLLLVALTFSACSERHTTQIRIENGWIAEIPPMIKVTGGFMVIHNEGNAPRYLVGAASNGAAKIEIHRSVMDGDVAKMVRQTAVEIPPRSHLAFSSQTGYHLMLYEAEDIRKRNSIPISLQFKDGSSHTHSFKVVDRREMTMH